MGLSYGHAQVKGATLFVFLMLSLPAVAEVQDPFEDINRRTQALNDFADKHFLRPVAVGYQKALPVPVKSAVGRVYGNLEDVGDAVNNLLQGKPGRFINDLLRVGINSTAGLGGLFDPASRLGLTNHDEDFAQTLARWGVPRGPYVVMPFLGPSSLRDVLTRSANSQLDPLRYLNPVPHRNSVLGMRLIHQRADLLSVDGVVFGDRYLFFREAFIQRREYLETDGEVEDLFDDDF